MLRDPLFIAVLARAGGEVTITAAEMAAAEGVAVTGSRNPLTGDVTLSVQWQ